MPTTKKNYKSFTGVKEFYYGVLDENEAGISGDAPERIEFLQNIAVENPSEISRAYGDNKVAELAMSNGPTTLATTFHKVPIEDKATLFGLKTVGSGDTTGFAYTPNRTSPYVACAFARTAEDGGTEWLGFAKGMFMPPNVSGQSKQDGTVEFGSSEVSGEFMPREIDGIEDEDEGTMFVFYDPKGSTASRDFLFNLIFGKAHPSDVEGV